MKNKSHICLVTSARVFEVPYGEGKFTMTFAEWLVNHGHNVIVMGSGFTNIKTKRFSESKTNEEKKDIKPKQEKKIKALYPPYIIYMFYRFFFSIMWTIKIIFINRKTPIKLIHATDTGYAGLAAVVAGRLLNVPAIVSSRGIRHKTLETKLKGKIGRVINKLEYNLDIYTINHADVLFALNSTIKNYFQKLVKKRIEVVPASIKLSDFKFSDLNKKQVRKEIGLNSETKVIGFVGRLAPEKNLFTLINAFVDASKNISLKLLIIGTGPLEKELRLYVKEKNIDDKVIFLGRRNDVNRLLSCFDLFILPSYIEGVSRALLEAMASGCAIICSDIPGNRVLIKQNCEGLLINPKDSTELLKAIKILINNSALRQELANNAKNSVLQYDQDLIFCKILQLYDAYNKKN